MCPVVVGRDAELDRLAIALEEARCGRGAVVAVTGEAGVGKTRLLDELAARARLRGVMVLAGRAVESVAPIPYRTLASAVLPAFRGRDAPADAALGPYRGALGLLLSDWSDAAGPAAASDVQLLVLEATARLLRDLAGTAGLLLMLDDLQWADAETLAILDYLAVTVTGERILCVVAVRSEETAAAQPLLDRLATSSSGMTVEVERLSPSAVGGFIRATLATDAIPAGLTTILDARAEGLPLAVEQVLADLVVAGALVGADGRWTVVETGDLAVPSGFQRLVERRLGRLDPVERTVVGAAALLGREFDWSMLSAAIGLDDAVVLSALDAAIAAHLVERRRGSTQLAFRHALIREGVLTGLSPKDRVRLAAGAATAVEQSTTPMTPEQLELAAGLRHQAGDPEGAARLLLRLGALALRVGAVASAESTLRRALTLCPAEGKLAMSTTELLADALTRAGHHDGAVAESQRLLDTATLTADGEAQQRARMRLARAAIEAHRFGIARAVLTEAHRDSVASRDIAAVAALRALLAAEADDLEEADRQARAAFDPADADPEVTCEALYVLARVLRAGEIEQAVEPLERAVALAELHSLAHWRLRAMLELATVDRHTSGRVDRCIQLRDLALETGAVSTAVVALLNLGSFSHARGGDWSLADGRAAVSAAYDLADRFGLAGARTTALVIRSAQEAVAGDRKAFEATLRELGEVRLRDSRADYPSADAFRGMWGLFQDDLDLARKTYREAAGWMNASPDRRSNPERGFDVLLRVIDGDGDESDVEGLRRAGLGTWSNRGLASYADAVCLGRGGHAAEAVAAVGRARADLRGHTIVDYVGLRLVAGAALRDGWGSPADWLREAREFFEEEGMTAMVRACSRLLRESGEAVPRRGRGDATVPLELHRLGVTSREMDVLLQLRSGSSNAEIAERLCMSRRTVETHVTRLLAKTGSRSRVELAGLKPT